MQGPLGPGTHRSSVKSQWERQTVSAYVLHPSASQMLILDQFRNEVCSQQHVLQQQQLWWSNPASQTHLWATTLLEECITMSVPKTIKTWEHWMMHLGSHGWHVHWHTLDVSRPHVVAAMRWIIALTCQCLTTMMPSVDERWQSCLLYNSNSWQVTVSKLDRYDPRVS